MKFEQLKFLLWHKYFIGHPSPVAVENMRQLFSKPLKTLLPFTQEYSYKDLERKWADLKEQKELKTKLRITDKQAQRLVTLGLSREKLYKLNESSHQQNLDEELRKIGVNSKPLREKLINWLA